MNLNCKKVWNMLFFAFVFLWLLGLFAPPGHIDIWNIFITTVQGGTIYFKLNKTTGRIQEPDPSFWWIRIRQNDKHPIGNRVRHTDFSYRWFFSDCHRKPISTLPSKNKCFFVCVCGPVGVLIVSGSWGEIFKEISPGLRHLSPCK